MGQGPLNKIQGNGVERRSIAFRFLPQGNSTTAYSNAAGTLIDPEGWTTSVARNAQGVFAIVMAFPVATIYSIQLTTQNVTDVDSTVKWFDVQTLNPLSFRVTHLAAGAAADMAANANNSISVLIDADMFSRS